MNSRPFTEIDRSDQASRRACERLEPIKIDVRDVRLETVEAYPFFVD